MGLGAYAKEDIGLVALIDMNDRSAEAARL